MYCIIPQFIHIFALYLGKLHKKIRATCNIIVLTHIKYVEKVFAPFYITITRLFLLNHFKQFVMKKLLLLPLLTFIFTLSLLAQSGKIKGRILGDDAKPLEFVTVTLHNLKDSTLVKGALSEADGQYFFEQLKNGSYFVKANQVGLKTISSDPHSISGNELTVNDLTLKNDIKTLNAVTVTAQKPFIEHQLDKTVVNVENSIVAAGSTALEVLEKAPSVIVDSEGKITLRGKQGVRVMIDGKPSQLSQDQLANLLRNTNASMIQKIEIITNPSSKYDAQGNAGIINIVMKKNQLYGTNGQVSATYGQGVYYKSMNSLNLNYRNGKWNLFGSYNYNSRMNFNINDITRRFRADNGKGAVVDSFVQYAYHWNPYTSNGWRGGLDFNATEKTTIGILLSGNFGGRNAKMYPLSLENTTKIFAPNGVLRTETHTMTYQPLDKWNEVSSNFNLKHVFDSTGKELTFDADYYTYNTDSQQDIKVSSTGETNSNQQNNIVRKFDIASAKFDYTHPLSKTSNFEFGGKSSFVNSQNDIRFYNVYSGVKEVDKNITNDFKYAENVNAAYANWKQELKGGISYQVGLRVENTNIEGNQVTTDTSFERHYTDIFPTAFVSKKWGAKDKHTVSLSYSRRIDRPEYDNLNPFREFLDRYTYQQGNPNLTPQYSNNVEVNYTFMGAMSLGLNYSKTNDAMAMVLRQNDATKQTFVTKENIATLQNYGATLNIPVPIQKWWFVNASVNGFINRFQGKYLGADLDLKIPALNLNIQNRFTLPKNWTAEVSGWYTSRPSEGILIGGEMYAFNAGISKQLLDKRLTLRLNAQDMFRTQRFQGTQRFENIDISVMSRWDSRQVRMTASYRFGNQKVQQARKRDGGAGDEKNRVSRNG